MPDHARLRMPAEVRLVDAGSLGGVWHFLRARVVVHTHGLYGIPPRSPRKLFVNLWHGWGTKELADRPRVAARQSDIVTVCSPSGQQAVAQAWGVAPSSVVVTGLPRNDAMLRAGARARPEALRGLVSDDVPLVLWLPTYRRSVFGELRVDGTPFDNDFQLPHCPRGAVETLASELGVHIIVKTHPMSEVREPGLSASLTVWEHQDLDRAGLSLYELMGHADVLVTDYSSAWVDYLLLDRPVVFTIADVEEYAATRGHDSALAAPETRPGPAVPDLASLGPALAQALTHDTWSAARRAVCADRHQWTDSNSARRVVDVVVERLTRR
jgi:CDP-glycerol glycerophosphotransferase (TagB/SpsB family)